MGYFPVRYNSRVVIYDRRGFIRLATVPRVKARSDLCNLHAYMQWDREFSNSLHFSMHQKSGYSTYYV